MLPRYNYLPGRTDGPSPESSALASNGATLHAPAAHIQRRTIQSTTDRKQLTDRGSYWGSKNPQDGREPHTPVILEVSVRSESNNSSNAIFENEADRADGEERFVHVLQKESISTAGVAWASGDLEPQGK